MQDLEIDALISEHGAKRVYHESNLPKALVPFLNAEVSMAYKAITVKGQFIKETTFDGVFYNIKFSDLSEELRFAIRADVQATGVDSPWQRKYPRIAIFPELDLPMPFMAVLDRMGASVFLRVKNFTLGGLLLDHTGTELGDVKVGAKIKFDVLANNGEKISDIEAMVMHISQELNVSSEALPNYQFGVKITGMSLMSDAKYRTLIKEYCLGVQGKKL